MTNKLTVRELKQLINTNGYTPEIVKKLQTDQRKGAKELLENYHKQEVRKKKLLQDYEQKRVLEKQLYAQGHTIIAGMDEAGRGPLAGPVVAAAVVLPEDFFLPGLNDSKQLSQKERETYFEAVTQQSIQYGIGIIHNDEIDEINIFEATKKAMHLAIEQIERKIDYVLIDAVELPELKFPSKAIIKGDQKSISIAASSVLAKVTRDRWMHKAAEKFPYYGFEKNKGYGTKSHLTALKKYGPSPYHRNSFAPVRDVINV